MAVVSVANVLAEETLSIDVRLGSSTEGLAVEVVEKVSIDLRTGGSGGGGRRVRGDLLRG